MKNEFWIYIEGWFISSDLDYQMPANLKVKNNERMNDGYSLFQLNYSEISNIIREMQAEQQQITEMLTKTSSMADEIVGRDWKGDAAVKFQSEMNELYLVKLRRVAEVLGKMAMLPRRSVLMYGKWTRAQKHSSNLIRGGKKWLM